MVPLFIGDKPMRIWWETTTYVRLRGHITVLIRCVYAVNEALYWGRLLRAPYTVVNDHKRSRYDRIRSYFAVIHMIVLRSYSEENGDCIRPPCTKTVTDRFFLRISPYVSVCDTEIFDRNMITCNPTYFSVYGRLRPCLFGLRTIAIRCRYGSDTV